MLSSSSRFVSCLVIFAALSLFNIVHAASSPKPPIRRIQHPIVHSLDVFPRYGDVAAALKSRRDAPELHHSDSFRLTLSAFGETYHLHLKPNNDLVHPAARVNYYRTGPDGMSQLYRTEPLLRDTVLAYYGEVVRADDDDMAARRLQEDVAGGLFRRYDAPPPENVLGWARVIVHSSGDSGQPPVFEGALSVDGDVHHVAVIDNYLLKKRPVDAMPRPPMDPLDGQLVIYRNSDLTRDDEEGAPHICAHDTLDFNVDPTLNPTLRAPAHTSTWIESLLPANLSRRDDVTGGNGEVGNNFASSIGQTDGCPKTMQIVYMGVAADCQYTATYQSVENATRAILLNWNSASSLYKKTFNVTLGIVELDVHEPECPSAAPPDAPWNVDCTDAITLNDRLSMFSAWRGQRGDDGIGLWHLMSGCPTGTEVGVAWLSTLCIQASSGDAPNVVSGTAVSTSGSFEWEVVAHEIGHNFGAIHDCTAGCSLSDSCCPAAQNRCDRTTDQLFLMNPTSSSSETNFSPCSIGNVCTGLRSALNTTCLQDASMPTQGTITFQMCGNGIVEDGEECDPGQGESSPCCDASTCRFRPNAVCDPASSPCCTTGCQFAARGAVCRPSKDAKCDVAETCSGTTSQCPADQTMSNGQACGSERGEALTCASGICTSVGQQCRLMGSSLNLTRACQQQSQTGCQVSCQHPENSARCLVLQATLPDGLSCGFGGTCVNGSCKSGNLFSTAKAWYLQNLQISVPITVVAGIVLLLLLWGVVRSIARCCSRSKAPASRALPAVAGVGSTRRAPSVPSGARPDSQEGLLAAPVAMPLPIHGRSRSTDVMRQGPGRNPYALTPPRRGGQSADLGPGRETWVDDTAYNGPRRR